MRKLLSALILSFSIWSVFSCRQENNVTVKQYPMFWTWLDYRPGMNFDSVCQVMNDIGMDGIMLNAPTPDDYRIAIPIARKHGIEVYAWLWTMNLEHDRDKILAEHPDWFSVNRNGKSLADTTAYVDYYKFLCPALPEVREFIREKIKSYCEVEGLNGIAIDYNRLVDVVLPTTLWPHYGIVQDREYAAWDYGYHPAMLEKFKSRYGYDPREQQDPSADIKWRQFRCDQITEVANMIAEYPYLCKVLHRLTELKQFTDDLKKRRLVVKVTSFAYKKGIPEDSSGNGGGFVFDCRAVNNPGKYERYKPFTGLDEPVVRFLEEDGEIAVFLEHVYGLVDASVKRYMERGFTNLSVCFGCTGGQHRSVYSAQHLAEHLNKKFGVQVNLIHREQNIEQNFSAKQ